ncbi:hypothetical protein BSZ39_04820 [Bowdeniella nasicola]|uniref:Solute-binding protein family 3/N-terminal domain-containing protein n=1 Tax=Bowdeniella nasicola TaxID=208480 RepID=A0A1Q5Q3E3_9ACTO|nr:hypothetical protein BSZ39_04820 [Bowdeniella nasicola]
MVALSTLLAACSAPIESPPRAGESTIPAATQGGKPDELTVGLTYIPDIQFAPFYVADKRGYFTDENLAVTLRHHGAGESLFGALAAGDEDIVNAGADEMVQARSQGVGVTAFAQMYQHYPVVLITPESSGITSLKDLKGKRIGVPGPFGENWFALLALLEQEGLSQSDVTIENIGYTSQAALLTEKVDAVMGFTNSDVVNFKAAGIKVRTFAINDNPLKSIALGATDAAIKERPEVLARFRKALARAMSDIKADPAAAVTDSFDYLPKVAGANKIKQAEDVLRETAALYGDEPLAIEPDAWPAMADFLQRHGLLGGNVDPVQAVNNLSGNKNKAD